MFCCILLLFSLFILLQQCNAQQHLYVFNTLKKTKIHIRIFRLFYITNLQNKLNNNYNRTLKPQLKTIPSNGAHTSVSCGVLYGWLRRLP